MLLSIHCLLLLYGFCLLFITLCPSGVEITLMGKREVVVVLFCLPDVL